MVGFCSIDVEKTSECKYISLSIPIRYTKNHFGLMLKFLLTEKCDISLSCMVIGLLEKKI